MEAIVEELILSRERRDGVLAVVVVSTTAICGRIGAQLLEAFARAATATPIGARKEEIGALLARLALRIEDCKLLARKARRQLCPITRD